MTSARVRIRDVSVPAGVEAARGISRTPRVMPAFAATGNRRARAAANGPEPAGTMGTMNEGAGSV